MFIFTLNGRRHDLTSSFSKVFFFTFILSRMVNLGVFISKSLKVRYRVKNVRILFFGKQSLNNGIVYNYIYVV